MPSAGALLFPAVWLGLGAEATRWESPRTGPLFGASVGFGLDVTEGLWIEAHGGTSFARPPTFPYSIAVELFGFEGQMYDADPGVWVDGRLGMRLMSGTLARRSSSALTLEVAAFVGSGALEQVEWLYFGGPEAGPTRSWVASTEAGAAARLRWPGVVTLEVYAEAYDRAWLWASPSRLLVEVQHDLVLGVGTRCLLRRSPRR